MKIESVAASNIQAAHTNNQIDKADQVITASKTLEEDTLTLSTQNNNNDTVVINGSGVGGGALPPK